MRDRDSAKRDIVRERVREQAQESARDLVRFLTQRARQDVDERLKHLDRDRFLTEDGAYVPPQDTAMESAEGLEKGLILLYTRLHAQIRHALDSGNEARARDLAARLASLPLDAIPQLREKVQELLTGLARS